MLFRSVNTGEFMRTIAERVESWIHSEEADHPDLDVLEERMDPDTADEIYELDRCIECGCCVATCGAANIDEKFLGAAGLNRVARFMLDSRDDRDDGDWFEVVDQGTTTFLPQVTPDRPLQPRFDADVTASDDTTARVWDALTGDERDVLTGHGDWLTSATFSPNGRLVASTDRDGVTKLWAVTASSLIDRKSTRLNSSHSQQSRMPSSA